MSNTSISESEVKEFIRDWYRKLDVHPPVEEMLHLVADEELVMKMPERAFYRHKGFNEWYHGVDQFRDQSHIVKALNIKTNHSTAAVKVIIRWERSDSFAPNRLAFYAAQTWTLERSPKSHRLCILTYNVDSFLEKYQPQPESSDQRTPDQDLELWKHYSSFGGQDKNTMVTIDSWLLGGSVAMLAYLWNELIPPKDLDIGSILDISLPVRALGIAALGAGVSTLALYISLLYGGYANRNWEKAGRIAEKRWKDLLPSHEKSPGHSLKAIAKRWARDCEPEKMLAPVFRWYFCGAFFLFVIHLAFFIFSAVKIWRG
jgi:hypothetical protein